MTVPFSTTTVTVESVSEPEPGEGRTFSTVASKVRAHVSTPTGREALVPGGGRARTDAVLLCDPVTLEHTDRVTDETTGEAWEVAWVQARNGLGLDHMKAGINRVVDL